MAVLSTTDLCKRFGGIEAVSGLSLNVLEGDVYGLLGLNGAGKTTALRMALGLIRPDRGQIELMGRDATRGDPESRRRVGGFIEGPAFYGRLTALENLQLLAGLSAPLSEDEALHLLSEVGLERVARRRARTFSLGMKQRLGIALALAPDPRLVILDEPTNGLDPRGIRDVRKLVLRLNRERGITFVLSSHLLHEVESLCTRVAIVHHGRLEGEGPLEELLRREHAGLELHAGPRDVVHAVLEAVAGDGQWSEPAEGSYLVARPEVDAADLNRRLVEAGARVSLLAPHRVSLEELFMARTEVMSA